MAQHAILRFEKHKGNPARPLESHHERQKAVSTLRELQYAGLVEIQKQGCGKPNRIYPKSYEAVSNTDFKKSGYGTPED